MTARAYPFVFVVALLAGGCTLGPNHQRPPVPVPSAWRDTAATATDAANPANLANTPWWELFRDPKLQALIEIALEENKDLLIAAERILEARASLGFVRADFFPQIAAGATFANETPDSLILDGNWEIDVFGRIRRATEAERALLVASEEVRRAVTISLVASVARSYIELRDFDLRLEIARRTLASRAKSVDLARVRFTGGLTSEKDLRQAEAEYRRVEVSVLDFERLVSQKENEISVLLGRNPAEVVRGRSLPELPVAVDVPAGLPSELLDRRPDLRAAEERLHAATADVGAAKALLFPRIALTGHYGGVSTDLDKLFTDPSQSWSIAAGLLQPIFQGGRNVSRVRIAESRMRQSLSRYEGSVLQAFRDVEDSLVALRKTGEQRVAQRARVEAERKGLELSEVRYSGGVTDYLEVLDAQRSLFSAELDEVQTIAAQLVSLVQLYKSLGGGWPTGTEDLATTAASEASPTVSPGS